MRHGSVKVEEAGGSAGGAHRGGGKTAAAAAPVFRETGGAPVTGLDMR
jgi:hypothetical protein